MDAKFKDTPSQKLEKCLKEHFPPAVVDEFFKCLTEIYSIKEWTDLYVRKAEGRETNEILVYSYSDTLTLAEATAISEFLFKPKLKKSN
tara:strand:+ start:803 stop:1069 length:267 start_codon:yes stop_codon:yes gene_type:complete